MKRTKKDADGTSFWGSTIDSTVNALKSVLGKPSYVDNGCGDKINFEWILETDNSDVFTVYDWKEYRKLDLDEVVTFHIGGHSKRVTEQALKEIGEKL